MSTKLARQINLSPKKDTIQEEVIESLSKPQKELSCKFFYDEYGSKLFEEIAQLDEYYLTRTEWVIMERYVNEISDIIGDKSLIIEPGSGSSNKVKILLDNFANTSAYVPIDISNEFLTDSVETLSSEYPNTKIHPIIADYTKPFELPNFQFEYKNIVIYYPGSTIGNFKPESAKLFLKKLKTICNNDNYLLIGIDLKKDKKIIEKAYNDNKGTTEKFNLNILNNLNYTIGTDFNLDNWNHLAFFNEQESRIEMHLISANKQRVSINGTFIHFDKGETIHTENSYKYTIEDFSKLISEFYSLEKYWTDGDKKFAIALFKST